MTLEEWHERINDIHDICMTSVVSRNMTWDEVVDYFYERLAEISKQADYPPKNEWDGIDRGC